MASLLDGKAFQFNLELFPFTKKLHKSNNEKF